MRRHGDRRGIRRAWPARSALALRRPAAAVFFCYLLVLQAIMAPAAGWAAQSPAATAQAILCDHEEGGAGAPATGHPASHDLCCDAGCLVRCTGLSAPAAVVSPWPALPVRLPSGVSGQRADAGTPGPPWPRRFAPQSPRGPPIA